MVIKITSRALTIKCESLTKIERTFLDNYLSLDDTLSDKRDCFRVSEFDNVIRLEGKPADLFNVLNEISINHDIELI